VEQLIFIGVILAFSVMEAIARGIKQRQQRRGGLPVPEREEPPAEAKPRHWEQWSEGRGEVREKEVPTYDSEVKDEVFDELRGGPRAKRGEPVSSEGLIPPEVWEEILGMSRGGTPAPSEAPRPPAPPPRRVPPERPARTARPAPMARPSRSPPRPERRPPAEGTPLRPAPKPVAPSLPPPPVPMLPAMVHTAHPVEARRGPDLARLAGSAVAQEVLAARQMLRARGSMRQAAILLEVLGTPASLRDDPFDPAGRR
jgi:hypothetical protein